MQLRVEQLTEVRTQFIGFEAYLTSLIGDQVTIQCQKVKDEYEILIIKLEEIMVII